MQYPWNYGAVMSRRRKYPSAGTATQRLRVGFVTPGLGVGGAERWVVSLAKHLDPAKIEVSGILSIGVNDPLSPEASRYCPLFQQTEAAEFCARTDVVIAWGWHAMKDLLKGFKGRVIGVSHASPLQEWHLKVCRSMTEQPGIELVGVSKRSLDVWQTAHTGVYIPNGVECDRVCPRKGRSKIREELSIPPDAKVALFVGRLAPEKRPEKFAEAVLSLPDNWYGIIAGSDIQGIGRKLPVHHSLKLLPAVQSPGDLLAASDVFVLPSTSEAHPLALTEAWLAGVATVYCDWPFAQQIREDHGSDLGWVIPVDFDQKQLVEAITTVPVLGSRFTEKARHIAWENYTAPAMAARWEAYLGV